MNRKWIDWLVFAIVAAGVCAAGAETATVMVRETVLRATPSSFGAPVATLKFADQVTLGERRPGWVMASTATGARGWIHESAIVARRAALRAGEQTVAAEASPREVALAGKGFSEDIEREFRRANAGLNFDWVDRMEAWKMEPPRIAQFLREGGVAPKGGVR